MVRMSMHLLLFVLFGAKLYSMTDVATLDVSPPLIGGWLNEAIVEVGEDGEDSWGNFNSSEKLPDSSSIKKVKPTKIGWLTKKSRRLNTVLPVEDGNPLNKRNNIVSSIINGDLFDLLMSTLVPSDEVEFRDHRGYALLYLGIEFLARESDAALQKERLEIVAHLLSIIDVSQASNFDFLTPLHLAVKEKQHEVIKLFHVLCKRKKINVNELGVFSIDGNDRIWTALQYAAHAGDIESVRLLLAFNGIDVRVRDIEGLTAFDLIKDRKGSLFVEIKSLIRRAAFWNRVLPFFSSCCSGRSFG